jgi:hypothetical protein
VTANPLAFQIFTSRYANKQIAISGLVPVGITVGNPRFRLAYRLARNLKSLAPNRAWFDLPDDEFKARYVGKLHEKGAAAIASELTETFDAHCTPGDVGLVLLCFEDLTVPGAVCHRRMFASYWQRETGEAVDELGAANG